MGYTVAVSSEGVEESVKANKVQRFTPMKPGKQNFTVYDAEVKEFGENSKSPGDPYYSVQLKVDGGEYNGRKVRVMVPFRTNWTPSADPAKREKHPNGYPTNFVPFFTALGFDVTAGDFEVPEPGEIMGLRLSARVTVEKDEYGYNRAKREGSLEEGETQEDFKTNNVQNFGEPDESLGQPDDETVEGGFNL